MRVSVDLETTGLCPRTHTILSWSAAYEDGRKEYALWTDPTAKRRLWDVITAPDAVIIGHNVKFDISFIEAAYGPLPHIRWEDTLLLAWLLDENEEAFNLSHLTKKYAHITLKKYSEYGVQGDLFVTTSGIEEKCKQDTDATLALYLHLRERLDKFPALVKVYENLYCPLISVVVEMEREGIPVDTAVLTRYEHRWKQCRRAALNRFQRLVGWPLHPGRNEKVSEWLFVEHGLKPTANMYRHAKTYRMKNKPLWKVDKDVLSEYRNDRAACAVLKYREYERLCTSYAKAWLDHAGRDGGRIHTHFIQCRSPKFADKDGDGGTATGRWASSDPVNMQTIPRKGGLKKCIVAPVGYKIIYADYGQLELRIMAHASQDAAMVEAFNKGYDLHQMTMDALGIKDRTVAKNCNFGLLYLIGAYKFQRQLWVKAGVAADEQTVAQWIQRWYAKYVGIPAYQQRVARVLRAQGYVETILHRRRRFAAQSLSYDFDGCHRQAVNATVQGTAADVIGMAMLEMLKVRDPGTRYFLQVHDSIALISPAAVAEEDARKLKRCMETVVRLRVPLVANVGIGDNLAHAEKASH